MPARSSERCARLDKDVRQRSGCEARSKARERTGDAHAEADGPGALSGPGHQGPLELLPPIVPVARRRVFRPGSAPSDTWSRVRDARRALVSPVVGPVETW